MGSGGARREKNATTKGKGCRASDGAAPELQEHRMSFPMVLSSPLIGYCDRACLQGFT